jgi:hypothetical protein
VAVEPGTPTIELDDEAFKNGWAADAVLNNRTMEYVFVDRDGETSELTVFIHERGNKTNLLQANKTYQDPTDVSGIISLNENESKKEWVVTFDFTRNNNDKTKDVIVSNQKDLTGELGNNWALMIGVGLLLLFAGAFSVLNAPVGAVIVSLMGGVLWFIGFLPGAATAVTVTIAIFISVLGHVMTSNR